MEHLNFVELRGIVGHCKVTQNGETYIGNITLMTQRCFTSNKGEIMVECTWHRLIALSSIEISKETLLSVNKGTKLSIEGRIRNTTYSDIEGVNHTLTEIFVKRLSIIE